jgi:hypothetical protein
VFVFDADTNQNTLASVIAGGTNSGNGAAFAPQLSASGRRVVFGSESSNLVTGDGNGSNTDVFVRDHRNDLDESILAGYWHWLADVHQKKRLK